MRTFFFLLFLVSVCATEAGFALAQNHIWSFPGGGGWQEVSKWIGGVPQGAVAGDILIHPDFGGTINGPLSNTIANNLTLGADVGTATLNHYANIDYLAFTGHATIESSGKLVIQKDPVFGAQGGITNAGEIEVIGGKINAGPLANSGIIRGYGQISAPVVSSGRIELFDLPGELVFYQSVTNQAGGIIAVRDTNLRIRDGLANQGAVSISDGVVDLFADINNTGTIGLSGGSSVSLVGNFTQNGTANLLSGSRLTVFGNFSGVGGTTGTGLLEVLGTMSVGNSPAKVSFGGDVSLGVSTLIELSGVDTGDFDALTVFGAITLSGALDVSLLNGFEPQLGDIFEIVTGGAGVTGEFTVGSMPDLDPNLSLQPFYSPTSVALAVVPSLAGDYNADGSVDASDYTVWRNSLGQPGPGLPADGNGNRMVDGGDYDVWRANFGNTAGSGAALPSAESLSAAVPEPITLLLVALASMGMLLRRRLR